VNSLVWTGFGAFFVVSLLVGVRLVALSARTRELPELLIGIGVLGIGPVGFGLFTFGDAAVRSGRADLAQALLAVASFAIAAGVFSTCVFTWRVYHPRAGAALAAVCATGILLAATFAAEAFQSGYREIRLDSPNYLVRTSAQVAVLLWSAAESLRYWRMMRRRLRIGLADPMVTNRFFLWGLAAGAAGVGSAIGLATQIVTGKPPLEIAWLTLCSSLHGLTAAVAMWLAFVPLRAYRRLIESRA
jgi:hypothetical protein